MGPDQVRKWKKYRVSKTEFPTRMSDDTLRFGKLSAQSALEKKLGRSVKDMRFVSEKYNWCWKEAVDGSEK